MTEIKSKLPQSFPYLLVLGAIYFAAQLITGGNYNIFRDEYYYIDCANHLAFGYVDHPSFSILILAIWKAVFGDSLISIRIIPALLGAATIVLSGFIAAEMGGDKKAQIFSAIAALCSPVFLGLGDTYSMNSFDLLFWALMFYVLIKIVNSGNEKLWLWFGVISGLGLMNKISIGYLGAGLIAAMICTKERKWFKNKYFWIGGIIAVIIFSPYIIWNMQNDFASLEFIRNASKFKNAYIPPLDFIKEQVLQMNPLNALVWIPGLIALLFSRRLRDYRFLSITYIVVLVILLLNNGKPYYLAAAYTALIPAGGIIITEFFERRRMKFLTPVCGTLLFASGVFISPNSMPVLTPDAFVSYLDMLGIKPKNAEKSKLGLLPQFFADRFGWKEMVKQIAGIYNSLSDEDKKKTVIAVGNYGEASSLNYYSKKYRLPKIYCGHNSHWYWSSQMGFEGIDNVIILGGKREDHLEKFEDVTEVGRTSNPYAMPFENDVPIYLAKHLRPGIDLKENWKKEKVFI